MCGHLYFIALLR